MVRKNPVLKKILGTLNSNYKDKDIQNFIDKLISWYCVKFSDHYLDLIHQEDNKVDSTILHIMDFTRLQKSFGSFEEELFQVADDNHPKIVLQKYLVVMAGWGLIYYKKSNPFYGYYRAVKLLEDFNSFYLWNLSPTIYQEVMERDYSPDNVENIPVLEVLKQEEHFTHKKRTRSIFQKVHSLLRQ